MKHPTFNTHNTLREKLNTRDGVAVGIFSHSGDSLITEAAATCDIDFVVIDMEASPMTSRDVIPVLQSLNGSDCVGIVRVPRHDQHLIGHALDIGAGGVMIPKVEDQVEAEYLTGALRYPPCGTRGINALRACAYGANEEEYMVAANQEAMSIVQIESPQAVSNLDKIANVGNVDVLFVGIGDLTLSYGVYGQIDNQDIVRARRTVIDVCRKYDKIPGIFAGSADMASRFMDEGFRFIAVGNDIKYFRMGLATTLDAIKSRTVSTSRGAH